MDIQGPFSNT